MFEKKIFCEDCRRDVLYTVENTLLTGTLKGEAYEYSGQKAVCNGCGSELYLNEVEDYNLQSLYNVYRIQNGIISLDKILSIPEKYSIGKRPLSLLLGWGEMTYSRYCDGDMPTKQYSDVLMGIYEDPYYFNDLLEKGKENLKSPSAYTKCKRAVDNILGTKEEPQTQLDLVIDYVLYKCEDITPLALQKALYYIQGFFYAFNESFLFEDECEAWAHGPVYKDIYRRYSSYKFDPINGADEVYETTLSSSEIAVVDSVIRNLCCYSGKVLENFTHAEEPWLKTRGDLPPSAASNRPIHKKAIGDYFKAVKESEQLLNPTDIEKYAKKMFAQTI